MKYCSECIRRYRESARECGVFVRRPDWHRGGNKSITEVSSNTFGKCRRDSGVCPDWEMRPVLFGRAERNNDRIYTSLDRRFDLLPRQISQYHVVSVTHSCTLHLMV